MAETKAPPVVTDADVLAAWEALYTRVDEWKHVPIKAPELTNYLDNLTMQGLRRVLEMDRKRVAEKG